MSRQSHPFQMALQGFNGSLWLPNAAGDGSAGLGPAWGVGTGTAPTQPVPVNTNLATMLRRTRFGSAGAGNNQEVGIRQSNAADFRFLWGSALGTGGFYFSATFTLETWINTGRLFVGMASSAAGAVCTSDTPAQPCIGLWRKTTHTANQLYLMDYNGTTLTETKLTDTASGGGAVAAVVGAGTTWQFEMWCEAFSQHMAARLSSIAATKTKVIFAEAGGTVGSAIRSTLLAPQVQVSNGTTVALDNIAIGIANVLATAEPTLT